jgi:hypothetical protein
VTASTAGDAWPEDRYNPYIPGAWSWVGPAGLDIVSYHDPRNVIQGYQWWQLTNYWVTT